MKNWSVTLTVPIRGDAADVVAAEIEQHQMLGALLRIGEQLGLERLVLVRGGAARAGAGDRADGDGAAAHLDQDFRARSGDREVAEVEEIEIGRGIDPPQRAIERERRQLERRLEALRQHDLEDVAGGDVFLGGAHHALVFGRRGVGARQHGERPGMAVGGGVIERPVERVDDRGEPLAGARERGLGGDARFRAHRRDHRDACRRPRRTRPRWSAASGSRPGCRSGRDWAAATPPSAAPCRSRDSRRCRPPSAAAPSGSSIRLSAISAAQRRERRLRCRA